MCWKPPQSASTGSLALLWDMIKWRLSKPKIKIYLRKGDEVNSEEVDPAYSMSSVQVVASNEGERPVNVTHLYLVHYDNWIMKLINREDWRGYIPNPAPMPFPTRLEVGDYWVGYVNEEDKLKQLSTKGMLFVKVGFTSGKGLLANVSPSIKDNELNNHLSIPEHSSITGTFCK